MAAFEERFYRLVAEPGSADGGPGLVSFTVRVKETDLWIAADRDLSAEAVQSIMRYRRGLEAWLEENPAALRALEPLPPDPLAPPLVKAMLAAGRAAGTGPMAAVAGAVAQAVAGDLLKQSPRVLVENGGDLYLAADHELTIGLFAGGSSLSGRLGLKVAAERMPLAVSTSSGTVGHSLSLGRADAATVLAADAALADAAATALGNRVSRVADLEAALAWAAGVDGVQGALVVLGEHLAAWGDIELADLG